MNFCIICTGEVTYICKKDGDGMLISQGFFWDDAQFPPLAVLSFVLELAVVSKLNGEFVSSDGGRFLIVHMRRCVVFGFYCKLLQ